MNLKIITCWFSMLLLTQWACQNPTPKSSKPSKPIVAEPTQPVAAPPTLARTRSIERDKRTGLQLRSYDLALHWEKLKCGLWKSKNNDLGYPTSAGSEHIEDNHDYFITHFGLGVDTPTFKSVMDTATFKSVGGYYFKDKNHVYHEFTMAGGSNFGMTSADAKTFQELSNGYHFKDKKHVFDEQHGEMEIADVKTFKTCARCTYYAKDKNGFYYRENRIAPSEIPDSILTRLKKL
jgi:DKNYY family